MAGKPALYLALTLAGYTGAMSIAFEHSNWTRSSAGKGLSHPEWDGLRARILAAHQARRSLDTIAASRLLRANGSFDTQTAQRLDEFSQGIRLVNPNDSTNRKPAGDMDADVVGTSSTGDRG